MTIQFSNRLLPLLALLAALSACSEDPPPRTVEAFMRDEALLEITLIRCSENRDELRYDAECINVRHAVNILAAREERARRAELEAQSQRKREALRRTQEAVAEARRRAAEERRKLENAEYILQYGELPAGSEAEDVELLSGNAPTAVTDAEASTGTLATPGTAIAASPASPADELRAVREELKRRNDDDN